MRWQGALWHLGLALLVGVILLLAVCVPCHAQPIPLPRVSLEFAPAEEPRQVVQALQILGILTVLALAPAILVMMTSFTRIVVVLSFVRSALALQQTPPNQVLIGLALFLTAFVMAPTWAEISEQALQPYLAGQLDEETALAQAAEPLRAFMLRQTREKDLALFYSLMNLEPPADVSQVPTYVAVPAFAVSELKTAFEIGFLIFVPFLVIDMVVASTLMAMGMLMLPPMMVSLPFKILLFVMVDGWHLVVGSLVRSFH